MLSPSFKIFSVVAGVLPILVSRMVVHYFKPNMQHYQLIKSFSLLLLGMFLSSLATLNFSIAFLVGLLAAPLTHIQPVPGRLSRVILQGLLVNLIAPTSIMIAGAHIWKLELGSVLTEAAFGWDVSGMTTQVVIWCVWWPAWLVGVFLLFGSPSDAVVPATKKG